MEIFQGIINGFSLILQPINLVYCFIGVFIGTLIGVLPGIGPVGAMSLLLPVTFKISPLGAIVMFAGIYYGSMYGGSTTSILVNIPGEAASVVTCIEGYQMAQRGRAGAALSIAAIGSFIAGTISVVFLMLIAPPLSTITMKIGPPEYFSILCLGFVLLIYLAAGSILRALMMGALGIILGCIGQDPETGYSRFTFHITALLDGIGLAPFVMGLFGISEVFVNIEQKIYERTVIESKIKKLMPSKSELADSFKPIIRGSILGFFLGILPGAGAIISSFVSYGIERRFAKNPENFGKGAIEGVAGPEAANNAAAGGAFIPLLTLGIPSNAVMALLLGAFMIHGVTPGPLLIPKHPDLFWGVVASMYVGNIMLIILNLPLVGLWVKILNIPYKYLFPLIVFFCLIGGYSINNDIFDIGVMIVFGVIGYLLRKFRYELAALVLAFVLGPMIETSLRQSLLMGDGNIFIFVSRPISAFFCLLTLLLLISAAIPKFSSIRRVIPNG